MTGRAVARITALRDKALAAADDMDTTFEVLAAAYGQVLGILDEEGSAVVAPAVADVTVYAEIAAAAQTFCQSRCPVGMVGGGPGCAPGCRECEMAPYTADGEIEVDLDVVQQRRMSQQSQQALTRMRNKGLATLASAEPHERRGGGNLVVGSRSSKDVAAEE